MKIEVAHLKESVVENFQETLDPVVLDLNTEDIKFQGKISISTEAKKEFKVVRTKSHFSAKAKCVCSRCLKEYDIPFEKDCYTDYPFDEASLIIDTTSDIREEIILGYPVKFLCRPDCKGLCLKCGMNLDEGKCSCNK